MVTKWHNNNRNKHIKLTFHQINALSRCVYCLLAPTKKKPHLYPKVYNITKVNFLVIFISDTSTNDYFNGRTGLKVSIDTVDRANTLSASSSSQPRRPSLTKLDSVDVVDCKSIT